MMKNIYFVLLIISSFSVICHSSVIDSVYKTFYDSGNLKEAFTYRLETGELEIYRDYYDSLDFRKKSETLLVDGKIVEINFYHKDGRAKGFYPNVYFKSGELKTEWIINTNGEHEKVLDHHDSGEIRVKTSFYSNWSISIPGINGEDQFFPYTPRRPSLRHAIRKNVQKVWDLPGILTSETIWDSFGRKVIVNTYSQKGLPIKSIFHNYEKKIKFIRIFDQNGIIKEESWRNTPPKKYYYNSEEQDWQKTIYSSAGEKIYTITGRGSYNDSFNSGNKQFFENKLNPDRINFVYLTPKQFEISGYREPLRVNGNVIYGVNRPSEIMIGANGIKINYYDIKPLIKVFLEDIFNHNKRYDYPSDLISLLEKNKEEIFENITATFETLEGTTIALSSGLGQDDKIIIKIDPENWQKASLEKRWYILYHELGHDVLNLQHGQGGKMMFNFVDRDYTLDEFITDRDFMFKSFLGVEQ